jgi:hypothetical protein
MKKRSPSYGQNGQLLHWWVLVHSGPVLTLHNCGLTKIKELVVIYDHGSQILLKKSKESPQNQILFVGSFGGSLRFLNNWK